MLDEELDADDVVLELDVDPVDEVVPIVGHIDCVPGELSATAHLFDAVSQRRSPGQLESAAQVMPPLLVVLGSQVPEPPDPLWELVGVLQPTCPARAVAIPVDESARRMRVRMRRKSIGLL